MIIYYISVADLRCTVPPAQSVHVLLYIYLSALGRVLRWVGKSIYYYSIYRCTRERGMVLSRELVVKRIKFDFAAVAAATATTTQFCSPAQRCWGNCFWPWWWRYDGAKRGGWLVEKWEEIGEHEEGMKQESLYYYYICVYNIHIYILNKYIRKPRAGLPAPQNPGNNVIWYIQLKCKWHFARIAFPMNQL